ncbi:hypothetical protein LTR22_002690 [Elasticomyces elasticus]|nr:hypothetical protein LTR22_002690 [Elasticomyces elasticus]KAK4931206.1 hypothetical protein LTR49_002263 [Elasticomyces elasticus]
MAKESLEELAHPEYWDKRYAANDDDAKRYDWLRNFETLKPFLLTHLPTPETNPKILHLGSGNSTLPIDLSDLGYKDQTAVDFSATVIANMKSAHPSIEWMKMDIRHLTFEAESFDICIDKATLDAMLYGSLWDPEDEVRANVKAYVDEVARVLKTGGVWIYVTWRQPHFIKPLISREGVWSLDVEVLGGGEGGFEYFGFVMKKLQKEG